MRNLIVFLIGLAMLSLWSCGGRHSRELTLVDSLLTAGEVSQAVDSLNRIDTLERQYGARDMNYYRLLKVMADDRSYVTHTTDSLIVPVIKYYESHGSDRELAKAYYYGGSVYRDLGDAPQALDYFQKALDVLTQSGCDKHLEGVTYSQMGVLYMGQRVYELALKMYRKSTEYSVAENDSVGLVHDYSTIGLLYQHIEQYDSAELYHTKALGISCQINDERLIPMMNCLLASLYTLDIKDNRMAKKYLDQCLYEHTYPDVANVAHIAAIYYYNVNKLDSAEIYSQKVLQNGDNKLKMSAYSRLSYIEMARKNPQKAMEYAESFLDYRNSVEEHTKTEDIRRINAMYNYQIKERDNNRLKAENIRNHKIIAWGAVVVVVVIFVIILYLKNREHKHRLAIEKLEQKEKEVKERYNAFIGENNYKIDVLEHQLKNISDINDELRDEIEKHKAALVAANGLVQDEIKRKASALKRISETTIFGKIQFVLRDESKVLNDEDWQNIETEVLSEYPNFRSELNTLSYKLTEQEYRVSLLIKLNIGPTDIATLICKTKETVTSIRRRLYNKVFNDTKGKPDYWDRYIRTL